MGYTSTQASPGAWKLARRQHGVVARRQLLELGFSARAIAHRLADGRLHPVHRGVYAVGRPQITRHGRWMAAVLSCRPDAVLSHGSAAALWGIGPPEGGRIEVSVPDPADVRRPGIRVHRRTGLLPGDLTRCHDIPVTTPACTLVDLATLLERDPLEGAVNAADRRDLVDPEALRAFLEARPRRPGVGILREVLDRRTFTVTDSRLERRFLPLAERAGLPPPVTQRHRNGFRADFLWPDLGLIVETDGLRYHRTAADQAADRLRDQAHAAAGLLPLRFTHAQVAYEPAHVEATLAAVASRLRDGRRSSTT